MNHERDFGLLISLLIPGFIVLLGVAHHSEVVQAWIGGSVPDAPSLGGFLYLTIAAVFAGLVVSTIRWATIDLLHHLSGLRMPAWNFSRLATRQAEFSLLVDAHYRYYQFYANSMIGILFFAVSRSIAVGFSIWELLAYTALEILFWAGSRDTLRKYYERVDALLSTLS